MRRNRILVLKPGQSLDELDLWPGDRVMYGDEYNYIGLVNEEGVFVSYLALLN